MASAQSPVQIEGLEPLLKTLADLPAKTAMNVLRPVLEEAGNMVAGRTQMAAFLVLKAAEQKGYKRKTGKHLYEAANIRVKMYRKGTQSGSGRGGTVFVAAGFKWPEGSHGHLVEEGHRIVTGGTVAQPAVLGKFGETIKRASTPGITAAGKRWLNQQGWVKVQATLKSRGRSRQKWKTLRGAWLNMNTGTLLPAYEVGNKRFGRQIRGGGKVQTVRNMGSENRMTQSRPMLRKAWAAAKGSIIEVLRIGIEQGIQSEAAKLAQSNGVKS